MSRPTAEEIDEKESRTLTAGGDFDGSGSLASQESSNKSQVSMYQIRPNVGERFRPGVVNEMIHDVLHDVLTGKSYSLEESHELCSHIANLIRQKVKEIVENRYKFTVQVVIAEQRGAGMVMGMRCLWDAETDSYATNQFLNDTIFCMAAVFAVYFY